MVQVGGGVAVEYCVPQVAQMARSSGSVMTRNQYKSKIGYASRGGGVEKKEKVVVMYRILKSSYTSSSLSTMYETPPDKLHISASTPHLSHGPSVADTAENSSDPMMSSLVSEHATTFYSIACSYASTIMHYRTSHRTQICSKKGII